MPSSYVLGEHFERFVKDQIGSGRYGSASEVIRDALRLMEEQEQVRQLKLSNLRSELQKGLASGPNKSADTVFSAVRERIKKVAKASNQKLGRTSFCLKKCLCPHSYFSFGSFLEV